MRFEDWEGGVGSLTDVPTTKKRKKGHQETIVVFNAKVPDLRVSRYYNIICIGPGLRKGSIIYYGKGWLVRGTRPSGEWLLPGLSPTPPLWTSRR